ncbi:hypothetical protein GCM10027093_03760 [Paraburkholderia jirisanensis]
MSGRASQPCEVVEAGGTLGKAEADASAFSLVFELVSNGWLSIPHAQTGIAAVSAAAAIRFARQPGAPATLSINARMRCQCEPSQNTRAHTSQVTNCV